MKKKIMLFQGGMTPPLIFMLFFLLAALASLPLAAAPVFAYQYSFALKKDELARVKITELGYEDEPQNFDFYWTLFDNTNIIVQSKFRRFPRQLVLSLRRNLDRASQTLIPDYQNPLDSRARLILEFEKYERGLATFKIYIEDKDARLIAEFSGPRVLAESNSTALQNPPQQNKIVPMRDLNLPQTRPLTKRETQPLTPAQPAEDEQEQP